MIPFDQIDARLKSLGKGRAWLSEASGRKPDSIRVALAPNAPESKRSELLQKALSDAIEREESKRNTSAALPHRLYVEFTSEELAKINRAANTRDMLITDWVLVSLNEAAERDSAEKCGSPPPGTHRLTG